MSHAKDSPYLRGLAEQHHRVAPVVPVGGADGHDVPTCARNPEPPAMSPPSGMGSQAGLRAHCRVVRLARAGAPGDQCSPLSVSTAFRHVCPWL